MKMFLNSLKKMIKELHKKIVSVTNNFYHIYFLGSKKYDKLNLGSGRQTIKGWLNIDFDPIFAPGSVQIDLRKKLPFPDNSISKIFSEHTIEHFSKNDGLNLIKECHRVLKPGGVIRFGWPDFNKIVKAFNKKDKKHWDGMLKHMGPNLTNSYDEFISDCLYSWDHRYMYTPELLKKYFKIAGFKNAQIAKYSKSKFKFSKFDTRNDVDTTYIEAKKE